MEAATTRPVENTGEAAIPLFGPLDGRCSAELRQRLQERLEAHPDRDVVIDMTHVESVDLTVLNLLSALAVRGARSGQAVVLVGCTPQVRRVLAFRSWRRLFRLQPA